MPSEHIYLDYAATTPVDPRVIEAMIPHFNDTFGNPSSVHRWGQRAEAAVESSRAIVAKALGCSDREIIFTASGSESDNLALRGAAMAARASRGATRILISPVEHRAVLHTAEQLAELYGFSLDLLPIDEFGRVLPDMLASRIAADVAVVSIIYANNEIGTINPIPELAEICRQHSIPFHTDAVQGASQLPIDVNDLHVDLMSLGAHKFYGPKGIGALYVREGTQLVPTLTGGSQEYGFRPGTQNTPLIVGFAEALRITVDQRNSDIPRFTKLRDRLISAITDTIPDARLTGHQTERLPNHASFVLRGVDGNQLLAALDLEGFACSSGSACKSGDPQPSQVLLALGFDEASSLGSLRVTIGRRTSSGDIEHFIQTLPQAVERLRSSESAEA